MKANELRLGNYVNVPIENQCPFKIDAFESLSDTFIKVAMKQFIKGTEVHPLTWYGDDLNPIPLTEKWMLEFGFIKSIGRFGNDYDMVRNKYDVYFTVEHWSEPDENSEFYNFWFCKYVLKPNKLKYVHQLQNLFFSITGEELTIKSE